MGNLQRKISGMREGGMDDWMDDWMDGQMEGGAVHATHGQPSKKGY